MQYRKDMTMICSHPDDQRRNERGSIVIMTALSMLLLLLMVGLCIDVSRIYVVRAELQNAADAAALTAAAQLNGGDGGIDDAVARANAIVNTQGFGKANVSIDSITFAVNLYPDNAYVSATAAKANPTNIRFVKIVTQSVSTDMLFASRALGGSWSENRQAVAGNSSITPGTVCDFFPAAVALADPQPTPGTLVQLHFNQGTGSAATLADHDYIILEVKDINGNSVNETAVLTAGLPTFCKTIGDQIPFTPSSNKNNGPRNSGEGNNTRFNDYAKGYGNALQPGVFHPDSNIQNGITYQQYIDRSAVTDPNPNFDLREDGRRMLIMPIISPGTYGTAPTNILRWALFFERTKSTIIQGGGCSSDPACGALNVEVVYTVGAISPVVPTAPSSSLTLPVLYR
jgi:Flp pilus assembly protein TadG